MVVIQIVLTELVYHKVSRLEGDVHSQLCEVAPVKGLNAFGLCHAAGAVQAGLVGAVVDLHALLDDYWEAGGARREGPAPGQQWAEAGTGPTAAAAARHMGGREGDTSLSSTSTHQVIK